jgi:hypothetical protein
VNNIPRIFVLLAVCAAAHDIPSDATAHAFIRARGGKLQAIVRVPLSTIRDIDFPQTPGGYLDIAKLTPLLPGAVKVQIADGMEVREGSRTLPTPQVTATQISLEFDRSFDTFDTALLRVQSPKPPNSANLVWNQVFLDALLEYPIESERSDFFIRPGFQRLAARVVTDLRFVEPGGAVRAFEFRGDPGMVPLDPRWSYAARRFVALGFEHILDGIDHLLFLLCLVIPLRKLRPLIAVVTSFTAAHSLTLIASAFGFAPSRLWFPPLVETLIAATIVYMALENIVGAGAGRQRWIEAFAFGLIHGFGFSFALRENLQLAGSHLLTSLFAFNLGVELGQVFILLVFVPLLHLLFRFVLAERMGTIIISALIAHTGWHWMIDRAGFLKQFR